MDGELRKRAAEEEEEKKKKANSGEDGGEKKGTGKATASAASSAAASPSSNTQESDPDVFSSFPFMRMHPSHPRQWFHAYQHLYAPVLFSFMTLTKVFQQDWQMFNDKALYHISAEQRYAKRANQLRFVGMKVLSAGYMMVLPMWFHGIGRGAALFILGHCVCGEMLATMFIVNHVIEGVAFAMRGSGGAGANENEDADTAEGAAEGAGVGGTAKKKTRSLRPTTAPRPARHTDKIRPQPCLPGRA